MAYIFKIAICDDDKNFVEQLSQQVYTIIKDCNNECEIQKFYDGTELVSYCKKNITDMILADVDMPNKSGFDAISELQKLQPNLNVIFVTAHSEFAYQAYDYNPFCFVNKTDLKRLNRVLTQLIDKIETRKQQTDIIHLQFDNLVDIDINNVIYLDTTKNYVVAHCRNNTTFSFRATIKDVYEKLRDNDFMLIQRGYIANCRFVKILNNRYIVLANNEKKTMTRDLQKFKEAEKIYKEFMRKEL